LISFIVLKLLSNIYPLKYQGFLIICGIFKGIVQDYINKYFSGSSRYLAGALEITYTRMVGNKKKVYIPYSPKWRNKMIGWRAYVILNQDKRIEITQQTGIPYLCSAAMLGGNFIEFVKEDKRVKFKSNEIPGIPFLNS